MSEPTSQTGGGDTFDLSQFYQVFFEEAGENLELMEQQLLAIDVGAPDGESLNSIFRCAHSVKGGAATFGFKDAAKHSVEFTEVWPVVQSLRLLPLWPTPGPQVAGV